MYAVVDFSEESKRYCTFDTHNLRIFIFDDNNNLIEVLQYNKYNLNRVKEMKIPIVYKTDTSSCRISLDKSILLGRIKVGEK